MNSLEFRRVVRGMISENSIRGDALDNLLNRSCYQGDIDCVKWLLADSRVDPTNTNNTPIKWACEQLKTRIVELLLEDGRADPRDENNNIIKWLTKNNNCYTLVQLLLDDGRVDNTLIHHNSVTKILANVCINDKVGDKFGEYLLIMTRLKEPVKLKFDFNMVLIFGDKLPHYPIKKLIEAIEKMPKEIVETSSWKVLLQDMKMYVKSINHILNTTIGLHTDISNHITRELF